VRSEQRSQTGQSSLALRVSRFFTFPALLVDYPATAGRQRASTQLYARHKSHSHDAQPEEFSPEQQNDNADERANNRHSEVHRISLDRHSVEAFVPNACVFDFGARHKHRYTCASLIGLVGFEPPRRPL
jgi:hypothetical protein